MRFCGRCGNLNPDRDDFCTCGCALVPREAMRGPKGPNPRKGQRSLRPCVYCGARSAPFSRACAAHKDLLALDTVPS